MRKLVTAFIAAAVCGICAAQVRAESSEGNQHFEFGSELFWHNYKEPGLMEQEGLFWGLNAAYEYAKTYVLRVEGHISVGEVDYTSNATGSMDNVGDYIIETRGLLGYDIAANESLILRPFLGFGYRYLNDDSQGRRTTTGAVGYERESNYYYSPIGLAAIHTLDAQWKMNLSGEYDIFWKGRQKSRLSAAIAGFNDLKNDQNSGHGARASLAFERSGKNMDVVFDTFVRYWNIDRSDLSTLTFGGAAIGQGWEPANETWEFGGGVRLRF